MLDLILSSTSAERVDVMVSAVDSASFLTSPLALCASRILSLSFLFLLASSVTLRAPFVGMGGRTGRSLSLVWHLSCLNPVKMASNKEACSVKLKKVLRLLVNAERVKEEECDTPATVCYVLGQHSSFWVRKIC